MSKARKPYRLQSLALASSVKKRPALGMEWVPRVSELMALMLLLMCWTAAAGVSWTGCRLVLL